MSIDFTYPAANRLGTSTVASLPVAETVSAIRTRVSSPTSAPRPLPADTHTMAYALVRIVESFLYADAIAGEQPDLEKAVEILKLMLR